MVLFFGDRYRVRNMSNRKIYTPDEALQILLKGNKRYHEGRAQHPRQTHHFRLFTHTAQNPFAIVSTCSDSRVPAEIIFDQGIGDLFLVRTAGNVSSTIQVGSIEYAVDFLGATLVLVMGHTNCGAITAVAQGLDVGGNVKELLDHIREPVEEVAKEHVGEPIESWLDLAVKANVRQAITDILDLSPLLRERSNQKKIKIVGALYHILTGVVEIFE